MSLIGSLEQFSLLNVLRRLEAHEKTGVLVLKQGVQWVEFYVRDGRLLCIGPLRTHASLGERLLQDHIITSNVLQETLQILGGYEQSETHMAMALIDLGYVSREDLRSWAIQKATDVVQALALWTTGDIYFEENTPPPIDRLLASMPISSILASVAALPQPTVQPVMPTPQPPTRPIVSVPQPVQNPPVVQEPAKRQPMTATKPASDVARVLTLTDASQFIDDSAFTAASLIHPTSHAQMLPPSADALAAAEMSGPLFADVDIASVSPMFGAMSNSGLATPPSTSLQAVPVMQPFVPKRIDTSFMRPDMLLFPVDFSDFREQNPHVLLTPDQWRLLTRVDGQTSLQMACQELAMLPELVCQVAGELMAEHLIIVSLPEQMQMNELSPISREMATSGLGNGLVAPGSAAITNSPWSNGSPNADAKPRFSSSVSFETESQWGNGGNGATFVPGRGWITSPQPMQPYSANGSVTSQNDMYAQASGVFY